MEDFYFVIQTTEDGGVNLLRYNKKYLLEDFLMEDFDPEGFPDNCKDLKDMNNSYFIDLQKQEGIIIIKGKIVKPFPLEKVVKYDIE